MSISGVNYFAHSSQHIRLDLWLLQVAQGLVHFCKLKFISLKVRRRLLFIPKRVKSCISCILKAFFYHSFRCPYRELFCSHKPIYQTRLVVIACCTGASTLLQAEIYQPESLAQVALYSEKSHCAFASQYLASQHLYQLEVTDMYPALTSK